MRLSREYGLPALAVGAAAVCGTLALAGCGSTKHGAAPSATSSASGAGGVVCAPPATVTASGSTAQQNAMRFWIRNYTRACPGTRIDYKGTGSGAGQNDFLRGATAFAGSDSPLSPDQISRSGSACPGGRAVDLPMVGGPIAVGYNLPGVGRLVLDAPTLAGIFDSRITAWDDPAVARLNPGARLPSTRIQAVHRSDSSGTTDNFTSYLSAAAPAAWPHPHDKQWPTAGGRAAAGSSGLADQVKRIPGAIGYFELSYALAAGLPTASIATGAPAPVDANVINASRAIAGARIAGTGKDLALKLDYTSKAPDAYPVDVVTYEIVCDKGNKPATWPATRSFLTYIAGESGQQDLSFQGYATLPAAVIDKVRGELATLS